MDNYQEKVSENIKKKDKNTKFLEVFKKLDINQKISLALLLFILVSLPLSIILAGSRTFFSPRAKKPTTPPVTHPVTPPSKLTPTPITSGIPVITTESLDEGVIGKMYNQKVEGYDPNEEDSLTMVANNLPQGLEMTRCKNVGNNLNNIRCDITGKPEVYGSFEVMLQISDNNNNVAIKTLQLRILE